MCIVQGHAVEPAAEVWTGIGRAGGCMSLFFRVGEVDGGKGMSEEIGNRGLGIDGEVTVCLPVWQSPIGEWWAVEDVRAQAVG